VRQRWPKEQRRRERDAWPIEMSKRRCGWRWCGKNCSAHTGARQPIRGAEPTPTAGEMRFGFRASPARQRPRLQNQKPATVVHVRHSGVKSGSLYIIILNAMTKSEVRTEIKKQNYNNKYKSRCNNYCRTRCRNLGEGT